MVDVGMSAEEESCPKDPIKNDERNIRDSEFWVNLNESRDDNPSEIQQTVKFLREELKRVKEGVHPWRWVTIFGNGFLAKCKKCILDRGFNTSIEGLTRARSIFS